MKSLYRDSLMTSKGLDPSVSLEQKAILIVTIRDPQKKGIAYNECIQQLRNRNFNHNNLQLTQKLQVVNEEKLSEWENKKRANIIFRMSALFTFYD